MRPEGSSIMNINEPRLKQSPRLSNKYS